MFNLISSGSFKPLIKLMTAMPCGKRSPAWEPKRSSRQTARARSSSPTTKPPTRSAPDRAMLQPYDAFPTLRYSIQPQNNPFRGIRLSPRRNDLTAVNVEFVLVVGDLSQRFSYYSMAKKPSNVFGEFRCSRAPVRPISDTSVCTLDLAYNLSLSDLEEMMAERGIAVDHTTIHRWTIVFHQWCWSTST